VTVVAHTTVSLDAKDRHERVRGEAPEFPSDLLPKIACPLDFGALGPRRTERAAGIVTGQAECSGCGALYEIRDGILRLLPAQASLERLVEQEQLARDAAAVEYDRRFRPWESQIELKALLREAQVTAGKAIVDLACGTGRITSHFLRGAHSVIAADISEKSLQVFAHKLPPQSNVGLVLADATQLRLAPGSTDLVLATQLVEHIPRTENRASLIESIHEALKPSGVLLLTVYYYSALRALLRRNREGVHESGIFYRRFTPAEIEAELGARFQVTRSRALQTDPRLLPGQHEIGSRCAYIAEKLRLPYWAGQLLLVKALKREPQQIDQGRLMARM
jgi:SAM-dependent methyltransferase